MCAPALGNARDPSMGQRTRAGTFPGAPGAGAAGTSCESRYRRFPSLEVRARVSAFRSGSLAGGAGGRGIRGMSITTLQLIQTAAAAGPALTRKLLIVRDLGPGFAAAYPNFARDALADRSSALSSDNNYIAALNVSQIGLAVIVRWKSAPNAGSDANYRPGSTGVAIHNYLVMVTALRWRREWRGSGKSGRYVPAATGPLRGGNRRGVKRRNLPCLSVRGQGRTSGESFDRGVRDRLPCRQKRWWEGGRAPNAAGVTMSQIGEAATHARRAGAHVGEVSRAHVSVMNQEETERAGCCGTLGRSLLPDREHCVAEAAFIRSQKTLGREMVLLWDA
ncbi:hypothetical protein EDF62_1423 [Leucobacter luti]|uniref:Uncharacterized protein n=1 Tax=Leucobacter luti TaxID=340320 RepID=A0A4R6S2H4_9MICO|nr:hypothetical protein EDF62_1423 [Leucobacter luti]